MVLRSTLQQRLIGASLFVAALVPFARALGFGFVYDDTWIVQHNPAIEGWRSLVTLWRHPYWMDAEGAQSGLYRPVHTALLAIIRNLGGGWPLWFHLYAMLLHGAATLLLWRMLARGVRRWPAALAALWFAVHPLHVEAIANISNSAESLVALWTLALYFVLARAEQHVSWRRALLAATLFLLAMLSKESGAMSLAIALLAAEAWRREHALPSHNSESAPARMSVARLWPKWKCTVIASAAAAALVGVARWTVLGSSLHPASMAAVGIDQMSFPERVWAMLSLGPVVFGLLGWPRMHNPYYGPSTFPTGWPATAAVTSTGIMLALAVVGAVRLARRRPAGQQTPDTRPLAAIGWTLLGFLPASNLLVATGQILAERTLYVPSIGVAMLLAWGLDRLAVVIARDGAMWRGRPEMKRIAAVIGCSAVVILCGRFAALAQRGTAAWRSHRALIDQMIAADPAGYRGHYLLAIELRRANATDSIAHEYAIAYRLYARDPQLDLDYARFLLQQQQPSHAVRVAGTLMDDSRMRNDADAIAVYLESRGRAYGADSVLVAAARLYQLRPHPTLALYLGLAHEARAERTLALNAYRNGLRFAPGDSALSARLAALQ